MSALEMPQHNYRVLSQNVLLDGAYWPTMQPMMVLENGEPEILDPYELLYVGPEPHGVMTKNHYPQDHCLDTTWQESRLGAYECPACAVNEGVAVLIAWDRHLDPHIRSFHQRRTRLNVERATAQQAPEPQEVTPERLLAWEREADLEVCMEGTRDQRIKDLCEHIHQLHEHIDSLTVPMPTTSAQQVEGLGEAIIRHHVSLDLEADSVIGVCGERVLGEQIGAFTSEDREAWGLFVEVATMCPKCEAIIEAEIDDDEDDDLD